MNTLRYLDEIIRPETLSLEDFPLAEKELQIGSELISKLSVAFAPQKYSNEHQKRLQALIDKKARGEKITLLTPKHLKTTKPDKLLETLQKSLKKAA
jgi:DNA end-binding protein Ku